MLVLMIHAGSGENPATWHFRKPLFWKVESWEESTGPRDVNLSAKLAEQGRAKDRGFGAKQTGFGPWTHVDCRQFLSENSGDSRTHPFGLCKL